MRDISNGDDDGVGRLVDADDLVSAAQVAQRVGTSTALVLTWLKRYPEMPRPVAFVVARGQTPVWAWSELRDWLVAVGVLPGDTGQVKEAVELMSGREIAALLGWKSAGTAWELFQKGTFPRPVRMERPRVWARQEVEEWARTHARRPSRRDNPGLIPESNRVDT